jgi:hypothetical protein
MADELRASCSASWIQLEEIFDHPAASRCKGLFLSTIAPADNGRQPTCNIRTLSSSYDLDLAGQRADHSRKAIGY